MISIFKHSLCNNVRHYGSTILRYDVAKVGDQVPISILSNASDPIIKEDSEYPEWLKDVTKDELPLTELQRRWDNDPDSLNLRELRRFKKLITLNQIKDNNLTGDLI